MPNVIILPSSTDLHTQRLHTAAFGSVGKTCKVVDGIAPLIESLYETPTPELVVCDGHWMADFERGMRTRVEGSYAGMAATPSRVRPDNLAGMAFTDQGRDKRGDTPVIAIYDGTIEALQANCPLLNIAAVFGTKDVHDLRKYVDVIRIFFNSDHDPGRGVVTRETFEEARGSAAAHAGIGQLQGAGVARSARPRATRA